MAVIIGAWEEVPSLQGCMRVPHLGKQRGEYPQVRENLDIDQSCSVSGTTHREFFVLVLSREAISTSIPSNNL